MIIEDQREHNVKALFEPQNIKKQFRHGISFEQYRQGTMDLEDVDAHLALRGDLIKHLLAQKAVDNMKFFLIIFCCCIAICNIAHFKNVCASKLEYYIYSITPRQMYYHIPSIMHMLSYHMNF
jgi:hypothetical protein